MQPPDYEPLIRRAARRVPPSDRDDCRQEIRLAFLTERFDPKDARTVAERRAIDYRRKANRPVRSIKSTPLSQFDPGDPKRHRPEALSREANPLAALEWQETRAAILRALWPAPAMVRRVCHLIYCEGLSEQQVGTTLGMSHERATHLRDKGRPYLATLAA